MSETKDTGGQAFPRGTWEYDGHNNILTYDEEGMTLRDYFAAKASEDDISAHTVSEWTQWVVEVGGGRKELRSGNVPCSREAAKFAYADAMLKERMK